MLNHLISRKNAAISDSASLMGTPLLRAVGFSTTDLTSPYSQVANHPLTQADGVLGAIVMVLWHLPDVTGSNTDNASEACEALALVLQHLEPIAPRHGRLTEGVANVLNQVYARYAESLWMFATSLGAKPEKRSFKDLPDQSYWIALARFNQASAFRHITLCQLSQIIAKTSFSGPVTFQSTPYSKSPNIFAKGA